MSDVGKLKFVGVVMRSTNDLSYITMFPEYRDAMYGLSSFSHTIILYWLHLNDSEEQRTILKVTPRRHKGAPEVGVFACRSPVRPNPIGLSVCEVVSIEDDTLTVRDLDATEGSPIIDIKPYISRADCVPGARSPEWVWDGPKT